MRREVDQRTDDDWLAKVSQYKFNALPLWKNGYTPVSVPPRSKRTLQKNWQDRLKHLSEDQLHDEIRRDPDHGTALVCGRLVALDLDFTDPKHISDALACIQAIAPTEGSTRFGDDPRCAILYRASEPIRTRHLPGFDVLGTGAYIMAYGTHPTGRLYRWVGRPPLDTPFAQFTVITPDQIEQIIAALALSPLLGTSTATSVTVPRERPAQRRDDGRDGGMVVLLHEVASQGVLSLDALVEKAWPLFNKRFDLSRPKRNGTKPWTIADMRQKAKYLLERVATGKVKLSSGLSGELTYPTSLEPFARAVDALGARRCLSPAGVRLSQLMLCLCRNGGGCYASVETLARQLDLAQGSVKRLRARLVSEQLWERRIVGCGRGKRSEYVPCVEAAISAAEKVTRLGALITSRGEGYGSQMEHEDQEKIKFNSKDFISLGLWTTGGEA